MFVRDDCAHQKLFSVVNAIAMQCQKELSVVVKAFYISNFVEAKTPEQIEDDLKRGKLFQGRLK